MESHDTIGLYVNPHECKSVCVCVKEWDVCVCVRVGCVCVCEGGVGVCERWGYV